MTLYHYVRNKDELITLMADEVMGEVLVPAEELGDDWRTATAQIARRTRAAFHRHHWALDRLGDGRPGPNGIRHFEQSLAAVSSLDLSDGEKFELISQIDDYVFGFCLREAQEAEEHRRGFPADVLEFFQRELDSGDYPNIRDFLGEDVEAGVDRIADLLFDEDRFERGLERLLDGIEAGLAAGKKRRGPKRRSRGPRRSSARRPRRRPGPRGRAAARSRSRARGRPARARPGRSKPGGEARGQLGQHRVGRPRHPRVELRHRRPLAVHPPLHRRVLAVPAVERGQRGAQALRGVVERERGRQVGPRVLGQPVGGARRQQRVQVGEVVVDGQPLHAGAARDVGDRRLRDADLLVQRRGRARRCGRGSPAGPRRGP